MQTISTPNLTEEELENFDQFYSEVLVNTVSGRNRLK